MSSKPRKGPREKDLTSRYLSGGLDEDRVDSLEAFKPRNKRLEQEKIARTMQMRRHEEIAGSVDALPIGKVLQVFSLFCEVEHQGATYLCVVRKTLLRISDTQLVVGDMVRFRLGADLRAVVPKFDLPAATGDLPQAVVEEILPRQTVLTRADSFKGIVQHPIVANAQQLLIVASTRQPRPKWGLIDRMLIAAQAGGLTPILVLNKADLAEAESAESIHSDEASDHHPQPAPGQVVDYYQSIGYRTLKTSAVSRMGIDELHAVLANNETVLAGHSGVGKTSLLNAVQATLNLRVGEVSRITDKGKHTTTSARRYPLDAGGAVIDTPGVKMLGLWNVTRENVLDYFPDVANESAPPWRQASYRRILESIRA